MALVLLLYSLFASTFTVSKVALQHTQPLFLIGTRMGFAGLIMLLYVIFFQKEKIQWSFSLVLRLSLLGFCNIWLVNALEFWGLEHLTSFKTCFIYSLSPFISALLSYIIFKEALSPRKWAGFLVGLIGFIPILTHLSQGEEVGGQFWIFSWPEIYVMGAAIGSCYGWILLRQLITENKCPPVFANGASMFIGGVLATGHSFLTEDWSPLPISDLVPFIQSAVALMIISNFIAYNLYGYLLKRYTATFLSFAGFTTPIFTALFGTFFLGEEVTTPFLISSLIVFIGLFLFNQEELKSGIKQQPAT
ncbi:DMT family transporter [Chlamydiales bacterium]|nr:DMT family transporter [Chlamydiales bacterium]